MMLSPVRGSQLWVALGYVCILCLSERATTMPNVYMLELLMIADNHNETSIAVELYATPCDVAGDDATALAGFLGGRTDERSRQDASEEKDAPMTEAHAMGKTSCLPCPVAAPGTSTWATGNGLLLEGHAGGGSPHVR
jgi:hypothetical protein